MDLNEKLNFLIDFIDESIGKKIYYINYFEFILGTYFGLIDNGVFNVKIFRRFISSTKQLIFNEFLKNNDFKDRLGEFLEENLEINKILEKTNMDYSILITNLEYQFEFLDKCDNPDYNMEECEDQLNKSIKVLRAEFEELLIFQRSIQKKIDNLELCFICNYKALNECIECGEPICEKHSTSDHCPNCVEKILKEKIKKT